MIGWLLDVFGLRTKWPRYGGHDERSGYFQRGRKMT